MNKPWEQRRQRVFEVIEVGYNGDALSRWYDVINVLAIVINLTVSVLDTYDRIHAAYAPVLTVIETVTVLFFLADYILRVWTAPLLHPDGSGVKAVGKYAFSFTGIIDLLSFLPYFLPFFFPAGAVAFRMIRVVRIFRLFRINAYYDSLNVIGQVLTSKKQQLISSVFIILVLMLASSLCMYSLEHEAQPDVFENAFSGIWWAASSLMTVGYGDIYPVTDLGRFFGIVLTFLGVGMVAIPTGIISAGFVEQYSRIKRISEYGDEMGVQFIKVKLGARDAWVGKSLPELNLPRGVILAAIQRDQETIVPRGGVVLEKQDTLVLGAQAYGNGEHIEMKRLVLRKQNPWVGLPIRELDISRQTIIVLVKRKNRTLIPNGDLVLRDGDEITLYSETHFPDADIIEL